MDTLTSKEGQYESTKSSDWATALDRRAPTASSLGAQSE